MGSYDDAFMVEVVLAEKTNLAWLQDLFNQLEPIPEVHCWYTSKTRKVRIIIDDSSDYYNGRCPEMNHSWCHGWIVRGICERIREFFDREGYDYDDVRFVPIEWIRVDNRLVKIHDDQRVPFELEKVPLHG